MVENQSKSYNLIELEEEVFIQCIFNIDLEGFLFKFKNVKDIVGYIFELKNAKCIKKF